jgi:UDP-N-acetylmuramoyl-tripeptide--D-alanyl-D-alanine ligase
MLELGEQSLHMHRAIANDVMSAQIDRVYACGSHMKHLFDALPDAQKGAYALTSAELEPKVLKDIRVDDLIMIKGSNGSRMGRIVAALRHIGRST